MWIGGAAETARICAIFAQVGGRAGRRRLQRWKRKSCRALSSHCCPWAPTRPQLTVGGQWQGPHVFAVHLRDASGRFLPGVRCGDNGPKQGLLGVDNGQVRVPGAAGSTGGCELRAGRMCF